MKRKRTPPTERRWVTSTACRLNEHGRCHNNGCSCYCHVNVDKGDIRPGVPPPNAAHFVRETLIEGVKAACNRAFLNGFTREQIADTVVEAMERLDYVGYMRVKK